MNENQTNNKNIFAYVAFCCFVAFVCLIAGAIIGAGCQSRDQSTAGHDPEILRQPGSREDSYLATISDLTRQLGRQAVIIRTAEKVIEKIIYIERDSESAIGKIEMEIDNQKSGIEGIRESTNNVKKLVNSL